MGLFCVLKFEDGNREKVDEDFDGESDKKCDGNEWEMGWSGVESMNVNMRWGFGGKETAEYWKILWKTDWLLQDTQKDRQTSIDR
jgi:hypothetical protein